MARLKAAYQPGYLISYIPYLFHFMCMSVCVRGRRQGEGKKEGEVEGEAWMSWNSV